MPLARSVRRLSGTAWRRTPSCRPTETACATQAATSARNLVSWPPGPRAARGWWNMRTRSWVCGSADSPASHRREHRGHGGPVRVGVEAVKVGQMEAATEPAAKREDDVVVQPLLVGEVVVEGALREASLADEVVRPGGLPHHHGHRGECRVR